MYLAKSNDFFSQAGGEVMLLWFASYYQVFGVNLEVNR